MFYCSRGNSCVGFLYTETCNSVYTNKLQSKNNLQILRFLLTKKLLAEIIKKH